MVDAILHIGFGKTGSSSIQRYLSKYDLTGTDIVYCALDEQGGLITGEALRAQARRSVAGYVSSAALSPSGDPVSAIKRIRNQGNIPLLSQEDWSRTGEPLSYLRDLELRIIAFVRPQIEWFNAAWWQWLRWEDVGSPSDILREWSPYYLQWAAQLDLWKQSPLVSECTVRLHTQDVVSDFLSILGCPDIKSIERINQSLSPTILKLYEAAPTIRRGNETEIDFLLSSVVADKRKAPWVLSRDSAQRIIDATFESNLALRRYISPDQRYSMDTDQRWWSADAYADRHCETLEPITTDELLTIVSDLSQAMLNVRNR